LAAGTDGLVQAAANQTPVTAAVVYRLSGWLKTEVAATDIRLVVDWYQSNGTTLISTSTVTPIVTAANTWTWYDTTVTAPALAAFGRIRSRNVFAGISRMWQDNLTLIPVTTYNGSTQVLTVAQVPLNGIVKTIPAGRVIRLVDPWRVAWGESGQ
jgi:hypothetical protein